MKSFARNELSAYYRMPKEFVGPLEADDLFSLHESLVKMERSFGYLFTAGSAAAESGLLAYDTDTDERHTRITAAKQAWLKAQDAFLFNHMHDMKSEAQLMLVPDKVQVHLTYIDIFHEMVDGYVNESTLGKLHASLVRQATCNKLLHDNAVMSNDFGAIVGRRGLGYEIETLLTITRLGCPSLFTIPTTARADHGGYTPEKTHDVRLIQQSHGHINWYVPFEVKPTALHNDSYDSAFVRGRVELLLPSSIQPLELARYMQAEQDGTISEAHLGELDEITSRVLTLAKDYRARDELNAMMSA